MKFLFFLLLTFSTAHAIDEKAVVEYINQELKKIPSFGEFSQKDKCYYTIRYSHQEVKFLFYELLEVSTFRGPPAIIKKYTLESPYPQFLTKDEAAKFFVRFIRSNFASDNVEYCANILKDDNRYILKEFVRGNQGSCPTGDTLDETNLAGGVHTHPGNSLRPDLSTQKPSAGDYAVSAYHDRPSYVGAPGGQILRYDKKSVVCRGTLFIKFGFDTIYDPNNIVPSIDKDESFRLMTDYEKQYQNYFCD